jgi:hypothetical protein
MIHELENLRSGEHTGGRKKKDPNDQMEFTFDISEE